MAEEQGFDNMEEDLIVEDVDSEEASEPKRIAELVPQHLKSRRQKTGSKTSERDDETPESEDETLEGEEETPQMDEEEEYPLGIDEEFLKITRRWEAFEREADKLEAAHKEEMEAVFKGLESNRKLLDASLETTRESVKLLKQANRMHKSSTWSKSPETIGPEPYDVWDPVLHQLALDIEFDFKALHLLPLFGPDDYDWFDAFPTMEAHKVAQLDYIDYLDCRDELRERVSKDCFNGDESALFDFEVTMRVLKLSNQSRPDLLQFIRAGGDNRIEQIEALIDGATSAHPNITFSLEKKELAKQRARQIYTTPSVTMKSVKAKQFEDWNSKLLNSSR